jgi:quinol monooxygenase YgiN
VLDEQTRSRRPWGDLPPTFRVTFDMSGVRAAQRGDRFACNPSLHNRAWYAICFAAVVIRLTLSITSSSGESWRLIEALRSLMVPTRREHGCVSCQLVLSSESIDPMRISYTEDWSSEEDLREQVRSDRFSRLLEVMEGSLEPPLLRFELPGGVRGLDYVQETRATPKRTLRVDPGSGSPDA